MDPSPFNHDYLQRKLCWNNGLSDISSCVRPCCAYPVKRHPPACSWSRKSFPWFSKHHLLSFPLAFQSQSKLSSFQMSRPGPRAASSGRSWTWGQGLSSSSGPPRLEAPGSDAFSHHGSAHPSRSPSTTSITVISTEHALLSDYCSTNPLYI